MITMSYDAIPIENSTAQACGPYPFKTSGEGGPAPSCGPSRQTVILRKVDRARATLTAVKNGNQALESVH